MRLNYRVTDPGKRIKFKMIGQLQPPLQMPILGLEISSLDQIKDKYLKFLLW